jgi:hypothetical protein
MGGLMKRLVLVFLSIFFLASGCASYNELSREVVAAGKAGKNGISKVYPVDTDQAWEITRAVFRWEKTDEIVEHRNENYVLTSTGMKMVAFGSVIGVWIEPVDPDHTKITVITRRRVQKDSFTNLTAAIFYEKFEQGVKIVKSGKTLPDVSPGK